MSSEAVHNAFANDLMIDATSVYEKLINKEKFTMLVYAGEFDAQDGPKT